MATITTDELGYPRTVRDSLVFAAGMLLLLLAIAFARHTNQPAAKLSPWLIVHLSAVLPAIPIGAVMLSRRKGDRLHRLIGRVWATLMLVAALSSFGIHEVMGHLSPIHILSLITLISLPYAIWNARRGRIAKHGLTMTILYASLIIAGYMTLIPTRLLGHFLFG